MAAPKLSPAAEKARRQKLIAIGGAVLLVLVLVVQVPRTMRMLNPGDTAAPAPAETAAPAPVAAPAEPVAGTTAASATAPAAELVDSDPPVAAGEGQLVSFDRFETKDPFRQQAEAGPPAAAATTPAAKPAPAPKPKPEATAPPLTVLPSQPTAPVSTTRVASATTIEVNGAPETVETGASFPAADPVFLLAERGADGTSVKVDVAGGEYSDGRPSVVLKLGETVTLMNTASGARYALKLLTVGPS